MSGDSPGLTDRHGGAAMKLLLKAKGIAGSLTGTEVPLVKRSSRIGLTSRLSAFATFRK